MSEAPPANWPGWAARAASLRAYLETPRGRSWPDLRAWAQTHSVSGAELLNRLAALEHLGQACGVGEGKAVRWVATGQAQEHEDDGVITSAPPLVQRGRRAG